MSDGGNMRVYLNNGRGCGLWVILFLVAFFMLAGVFFKFLFTTPIGLVVLGFGIVYYMVQKQRIQKQMNEYEKTWYTGNEETTTTTETESNDFNQESIINRDAEDVVFYDAEDQSND